MARALTAGELERLRKDGQKSILYLAVHDPATVFTAQVNGAPSDTDEVSVINYDGGSAGYANAVPGMTVHVGTQPGAYNKGQVRLRGALPGTSGSMAIGETSEIDWADNDHLTIVDEFSIWARHLYIDDDGNVFMDRNVSYYDQHAKKAPVPVLGPPAVAWLTGGSATINFDAGDSFCLGSSISAYVWAASGGSWDDASLAAPTLTVTAAGTYRVSCTVTAANGKSLTGHRYVFVFDESNPPVQSFALDSCSGSWQSGGWSFKVTMVDEALRTEIRDRAMVVLFARDWYGDAEVSVGPISARENVVAVGWIAGETIKWDPEQGEVSFEVQGPHWWINRVTGFPVGVEDHTGAPTAWTEMENLTVDKGLWHLLHWRSTATLMMDIRLTGDSRQGGAFEDAAGTLWQQMKNAAGRAILAQPCCDRYGRLFVQIDSQFMPTGDRSSIPIVHSLEKQDWIPPIDIQRSVANKVAQVDLSGVAYSGGDGQALFSLAPGHIFSRWGDSVDMRDHLALSSQSQANTLAGLIFGNQNNPYPRIPIDLASNHRMIDICPRQYVSIDIGAADTERGIVKTGFKLVPRRVSYDHNPEAGVLLTRAEFEGYTDESTSCDGDPPPTLAGIEMPPPPAPPPVWIPPLPSPTGTVINPGDEMVYVTGVGTGIWYTPDGGQTWYDISGEHAGETGYDVKAWKPSAQPSVDEIVLWWVADGYIHYSSNGGQSWAVRSPGGPATMFRTVEPRHTDADTCYALGLDAAKERVYVYLTQDAGLNWSYVEVSRWLTNYYYTIPEHSWPYRMAVNSNASYVFLCLSHIAELQGDSDYIDVVRFDPDLTNELVYYNNVGTYPGYYLSMVCKNAWPSDDPWLFGVDWDSDFVLKGTDWGTWYQSRKPNDGEQKISLLLPRFTAPTNAKWGFTALDGATKNLYELVEDDTSWAWTKYAGVLPFDTRAGGRGYPNEDVLWIGRASTGTPHLQRSADGGLTWQERSTGITPSDAEITAITVINA